MISPEIISSKYRDFEKKRLKKGESNGRSMFTETDIVKIKNMISEGMALKDIATKYHVSAPTISAIKRGITWSHIK